LHNSQPNDGRHIASIDYVVSSNGAFGETYEAEHALTRGNPFRGIWRRLWMIVLIAAVFAGSAAVFSDLQTPTYQASVRLLVGQDEEATYTPNLQTEVMGLQLLTKTMAQAVVSRTVAEDVIERLDLSMAPGTLRSNLEAKQVADTQFVDIKYKDSDPERARLIANTVGDVFSEQVSGMNPSSNYTITATIWERAAQAGKVSPQPQRNVLLALALGLIVGVGLALLLDYLKDDWRSPEEAERVSGVPTLAAIPAFKVRKRNRGGN
jgi:capsular polysaccharide biosynthesis protein